jgi:hypothetical protein
MLLVKLNLMKFNPSNPWFYLLPNNRHPILLPNSKRPIPPKARAMCNHLNRRLMLLVVIISRHQARLGGHLNLLRLKPRKS